MTLPKRLEVGPWWVGVKQSQKDDLKLEGLMGHWIEQDSVIRIKRGIAPCVERETVMHECLHALFGLTGLSDKFQTAFEEDIIRRIAPPLLDLLRRNPELVAYLLEAA